MQSTKKILKYYGSELTILGKWNLKTPKSEAQQCPNTFQDDGPFEDPDFQGFERTREM